MINIEKKVNLATLFCNIDNFVKTLNQSGSKILISMQKSKRGLKPMMSLSELMTIIVMYHSSVYKNFKSYYLFLKNYRSADFLKLLSYNRFIEWMPYQILLILKLVVAMMQELNLLILVQSLFAKRLEYQGIEYSKALCKEKNVAWV